MAGQLSAVGAQALANHIGGIVPPHIGSSAPVWQPGLVWINTSSTPVASYWNTTAWVPGPEGKYIALLTGDPSTSGPGGGYAQAISDLIEDPTAGYARQSVTFAGPVPYLSGSTYTLGQQVTFAQSVYVCEVATVTGTAPSGTTANTTDWTYFGPAYPAPIANTNLLTFNYSAKQQSPVQWAALVTASSGNTGLLQYMWKLTEPQQVQATQFIDLGAGLLTLVQS